MCGILVIAYTLKVLLIMQLHESWKKQLWENNFIEKRLQILEFQNRFLTSWL